MLFFAAAACVALLPFLAGFWPVLVAVILLSACFVPVTRFFDSATTFMLAGPIVFGLVILGIVLLVIVFQRLAPAWERVN